MPGTRGRHDAGLGTVGRPRRWAGGALRYRSAWQRWLEAGTTRELEGFRWRCMADPEGNEFDIDVLPPGA